jgi:hypothetical protein
MARIFVGVFLYVASLSGQSGHDRIGRTTGIGRE